jgi:uncharacterized protein YktB (UPF0637 family)
MAGLGIGPDQFATFRIVDPDERERALEGAVLPALTRIGDGLLAGLSRLAAASLVQQQGKLQRRKGAPPEEALVAFCAADKLFQKVPHLALAATRGHLHARVAARAAADRDGAIQRAVQREAPNLARRGKPFRKLRSYVAWEPDHDELPEVAPAHSSAFWEEMAEGLGRDRNGSGGIDLGIAWTAEEARSLALGDVLGAFRDLSPLYKLFAAAK